ncbi:O-antigen ligase family protein [Parabacteroides merdae]|uniref:O-antigen ligase family protein n=1 Tax=Parabacteroides merdae TaxID=46503 RepID=UPI000EBDA03C|nr:O-antigen ligase family protein [Parabacteroides merdae]RGM98413.1 O-antigen ligase domain-containing protein [Parabacteroides merdae]
MSLIRNYRKYLITLFVVYLTLAPTPIVDTGLMRFFPTLTFVIILFCGICSFKTAKAAQLGTIVSVFFIYIVLCAIFHPSIEGNKLMTLLKSSYWCCVYFITYAIFSVKNIGCRSFDKKVMITTILLALSFNYSHASRLMNFDLIGDNAVFYPLLMIPWIACISNTTKRWIMIVIVSLCAITALKRSGIIIMSISVILLYYSDFFRRKCLHPKSLFAAILVIAGIFTVYQYKAESIYDISKRFEMIKADGGNGRDMIYEDVINRYRSEDLIQQVIGKGFDSVKGKDTTIALSAHNDFLEVLYDFGAIGFFLYVLMHFSLIKWTVLLFRKRSQLAFPMLVSYVCFVVMSMVSHLILYPTYFGLLVSFWAFAECKDRKLQY